MHLRETISNTSFICEIGQRSQNHQKLMYGCIETDSAAQVIKDANDSFWTRITGIKQFSSYKICLIGIYLISTICNMRLHRYHRRYQVYHHIAEKTHPVIPCYHEINDFKSYPPIYLLYSHVMIGLLTMPLGKARY